MTGSSTTAVAPGSILRLRSPFLAVVRFRLLLVVDRDSQLRKLLPVNRRRSTCERTDSALRFGEGNALADVFQTQQNGNQSVQAQRDAATVLERVGLGHRLDHLPSEVSGGQQQRIAIARALVNEPEIILADEPTGNLDLHTGQEIINLLTEMKDSHGITVISATHDMKMLSTSDRVAWIRDGNLERVARQDEVNITVGQVDGETGA